MLNWYISAIAKLVALEKMKQQLSSENLSCHIRNRSLIIGGGGAGGYKMGTSRPTQDRVKLGWNQYG